MRYLLLDRITEWKPPEFARGVKAVALSEDYFADHFPLHPLMPGALILEAMAQLSGVLVGESIAQTNPGELGYSVLTLVERAKFRMVVQPGDRLDLESRLLQVNEQAARVNATAKVDDRVAASATLVFTFQYASREKVLAEQKPRLDYLLNPTPPWQRR